MKNRNLNETVKRLRDELEYIQGNSNWQSNHPGTSCRSGAIKYLENQFASLSTLASEDNDHFEACVIQLYDLLNDLYHTDILLNDLKELHEATRGLKNESAQYALTSSCTGAVIDFYMLIGIGDSQTQKIVAMQKHLLENLDESLKSLLLKREAARKPYVNKNVENIQREKEGAIASIKALFLKIQANPRKINMPEREAALKYVGAEIYKLSQSEDIEEEKKIRYINGIEELDKITTYLDKVTTDFPVSDSRKITDQIAFLKSSITGLYKNVAVYHSPPPSASLRDLQKQLTEFYNNNKDSSTLKGLPDPNAKEKVNDAQPKIAEPVSSPEKINNESPIIPAAKPTDPTPATPSVPVKVKETNQPPVNQTSKPTDSIPSKSSPGKNKSYIRGGLFLAASAIIAGAAVPCFLFLGPPGLILGSLCCIASAISLLISAVNFYQGKTSQPKPMPISNSTTYQDVTQSMGQTSGIKPSFGKQASLPIVNEPTAAITVTEKKEEKDSNQPSNKPGL